MIAAATLQRRSSASPAPELPPATAAELVDLARAARALLRVDDLHLDNRDEKAALRDALVRLQRRRP